MVSQKTPHNYINDHTVKMTTSAVHMQPFGGYYPVQNHADNCQQMNAYMNWLLGGEKCNIQFHGKINLGQVICPQFKGCPLFERSAIRDFTVYSYTHM